MSPRDVLGVFALAIALVLAVPRAQAQTPDHAMKIHFSNAVEVPGRVLPAGTYLFAVRESPDENQVEIFSADRKLLAIEQAIPMQRMEPTSKVQVTFADRAGSDPAVVSWFLPGETEGYQFLYPKGERMSVEQAPEQTVAAGKLDTRMVSGD